MIKIRLNSWDWIGPMWFKIESYNREELNCDSLRLRKNNQECECDYSLSIKKIRVPIWEQFICKKIVFLRRICMNVFAKQVLISMNREVITSALSMHFTVAGLNGKCCISWWIQISKLERFYTFRASWDMLTMICWHLLDKELNRVFSSKIDAAIIISLATQNLHDSIGYFILTTI